MSDKRRQFLKNGCQKKSSDSDGALHLRLLYPVEISNPHHKSVINWKLRSQGEREEDSEPEQEQIEHANCLYNYRINSKRHSLFQSANYSVKIVNIHLEYCQVCTTDVFALSGISYQLSYHVSSPYTKGSLLTFPNSTGPWGSPVCNPQHQLRFASNSGNLPPRDNPKKTAHLTTKKSSKCWTFLNCIWDHLEVEELATFADKENFMACAWSFGTTIL